MLDGYLAGLVGKACNTLDLGDMSSSPILGVQLTLKKKKKERKEKKYVCQKIRAAKHYKDKYVSPNIKNKTKPKKTQRRKY